MSDLPRIHPREAIVNRAESNLRVAIEQATDGLTSREALRIVSSAFHHYLAGWAKYAIRKERHGDLDTPGGRE